MATPMRNKPRKRKVKVNPATKHSTESNGNGDTETVKPLTKRQQVEQYYEMLDILAKKQGTNLPKKLKTLKSRIVEFDTCNSTSMGTFS